jgi:transcriptional regulator with XRE-family HTH domain
MLEALGRRDIAAVYRLLQRQGVTQRRIANLTGQSQSEISEILGGRRVSAYDVLVRIADGLGVPRGLLGLAHDDRVGVVRRRLDDRPVLDAESGRWVVRVPVYADSYNAALGLCEPVRATSTAGAGQPDVAVLDEVAARRWRQTAETILGARVRGLPRAG